MQWTAEQLAIFEAGINSPSNLLVTARAGAAKTTSIVELANRYPARTKGLFLAFNKMIQEEAKTRLPANFRAMTMHGCGMNAWRSFIRRPIKVDKDKIYNLVTEIAAKLEKKEADFIWEKFGELRKAISMAKTAGYIPKPLPQAYRPLVSAEDFYSVHLDFNAEELEREVIDEVLKRSWKQTCEGILDFDDMILAPAVAGVSFDHYDVILTDESQDFSFINHVMIRKLTTPTTKLISVGDPCQAIYGFRGADETSMQSLKELFSMQELFLTTSFRCSRAVCENAQWRAPDMNSPDWAQPGSVNTLTTWNPDDIPDGAAIICRNNAPLFSIAIQLLRSGRYPELRGRDVLKGLVAVMKKLGKEKLSREEAIRALDAWYATEKLRQRDSRLLQDRRDCIRIFLNETETLGQAIAYAKGLGEQSGRIYLMTGHGSKGLEFENVFILDKHLIDIKHGQDNNVLYVMETRAKLNLTYITSEGFESHVREEAESSRA